jgi:hypothetical protein
MFEPQDEEAGMAHPEIHPEVVSRLDLHEAWISGLRSEVDGHVKPLLQLLKSDMEGMRNDQRIMDEKLDRTATKDDTFLIMQKVGESHALINAALQTPSTEQAKSQEKQTFWLIIATFGLTALAVVGGFIAYALNH